MVSLQRSYFLPSEMTYGLTITSLSGRLLIYLRGDNPPMKRRTLASLWLLTSAGAALNKNYLWCWLMQVQMWAFCLTSRKCVFPGSATKRLRKLSLRSTLELLWLILQPSSLPLKCGPLKLSAGLTWLTFCGILQPTYYLNHHKLSSWLIAGYPDPNKADVNPPVILSHPFATSVSFLLH